MNNIRILHVSFAQNCLSRLTREMIVAKNVQLFSSIFMIIFEEYNVITNYVNNLNYAIYNIF